MMRPLVIDNFAGGGGASTGIERALGRSVDIAINHDPEAVAMHAANHPGTKHYCQSILAVDPLDATGGNPVGFVWFSPDCTHHSKAKGGKPREKNIRDLAWVVVHWAERLLKAKPDGSAAIQVIALENVEEFRQWGPLDEDGMPIKARRGEEFDLWCRRLRRLGYKVEYRELRACDYGAPTLRKRLYLIARRDKRPIVWPAPTHALLKSAKIVDGVVLDADTSLRPYRTAAECIDWSIACPSIFARKRPLKDATQRRIAHGVMRYVVNAARPFIVPVTHTKGNKRPASANEPLRTVTTAKGGEFAACDVSLAPTIVGCGGRRGQSGPVDPAGPYPTITAKADACLVEAVLAPHVTKFRTGSVGSDFGRPMPTVTANGQSARPAGATPLGLAGATMVQMGYGEREEQSPRSLDVDMPLGTIVAGGAKHAAVTAFLSTFYSNGGKHSVEDPAPTIMAGSNKHAVVCAHIEQANTGTMLGRKADTPLTTITTTGSQQRIVQTVLIAAEDLPAEQLAGAVRVAVFLIKYYGNEVDGHGLDAPIGTVTTRDRFAVVTVTIDAVTYVIVDIGMRMLTRRELANAQGFPADYILDPIGPNGKPLSISSSIRMIGNSVCPDVAEALVRANVPELCEVAQPAEVAA